MTNIIGTGTFYSQGFRVCWQKARWHRNRGERCRNHPLSKSLSDSRNERIGTHSRVNKLAVLINVVPENNFHLNTLVEAAMRLDVMALRFVTQQRSSAPLTWKVTLKQVKTKEQHWVICEYEEPDWPDLTVFFVKNRKNTNSSSHVPIIHSASNVVIMLGIFTWHTF